MEHFEILVVIVKLVRLRLFIKYPTGYNCKNSLSYKFKYHYKCYDAPTKR